MTTGTRGVLIQLAEWDRRRVALLTAKNPSLNRDGYRARQDRAEAALGDPIDAWTSEVREHYQVLIEAAASHLGGKRIIVTHNEGPQRIPPARLDAKSLVAAADEIGVRTILQRCGDETWTYAELAAVT